MSDYKRLTKNKPFEELDLKDEWGYSHIYKRLQELENKIENGTLKDLPCKVGDTVFLIAKANKNLYYGNYFTVEKIGFDKLGFFVENERGIFRKEHIFLNKAEAEKKLEELREKK